MAAERVIPQQLWGALEEKLQERWGCGSRRLPKDTSSSQAPEPVPHLHCPPRAGLWSRQHLGSGLARPKPAVPAVPACISVPSPAQQRGSCYFPGSFED